MIRLILIVFFFLLSLLTVFKAPAYYFWLLAIVVTEYPLIFIGITSLLILSGIWIHKYQLACTTLGIISVLLCVSPILRAYVVSNNLKQSFNAAFGEGSTILRGSDTENPFNISGLFKSLPTVGYKTLNYATYPDIKLTLDFYPSATAGNRPCVIVVHGGSWSSGDSQQLPGLNSYLAHEGYNVASINYRMAPKYQTPAPVQDIDSTLNYLRHHAGELHIDTDNFVLLGRSAGAQIALLAAYTLHEKGLKGVIDFYGPADMVWGYSIPSNPLIMDSRKVMEDYLGGTYKAVPQKYIASSPIEFVSAHSLPTLIIHGGLDVLVSPEHSRRLNKKLDENKVPHYWLKLPWATHGFDFSPNGPGGQLATYTIDRFLNIITK